MPKLTNAQWAATEKVRWARMVAVRCLRDAGCSYKEIAIAIYTTPERVRALEAKLNRLTRQTNEL